MKAAYSGGRRLPRAASAARLLLFAALASAWAACAAGSRDPVATRPRGAGAPPYPVVLGASAERRERAVNNWLALAKQPAGAAAPELQPVTATVRALPQPAPDSLRLPPVEIGGADETTRDEETRESLRRFIAGATDLLGVEPQNLSLQEFNREAGGGFARYLQKPFPHPVRNGYGVVEIRFDAAGRVLSLASTAVPDTERLTQAVAALRPYQIPTDQIASRLRDRSFNFAAPGAAPGAAGTFTVAPGTDVDVRELVVFPVPVAAGAPALEIRLAWETIVGRGGTNFLVYADAVTGEILSSTRTAETPRPTPQPTPPATAQPSPSQPRPTATPAQPTATTPTVPTSTAAPTATPAPPATVTPPPRS